MGAVDHPASDHVKGVSTVGVDLSGHGQSRAKAMVIQGHELAHCGGQGGSRRRGKQSVSKGNGPCDAESSAWRGGGEGRGMMIECQKTIGLAYEVLNQMTAYIHEEALGHQGETLKGGDMPALCETEGDGFACWQHGGTKENKKSKSPPNIWLRAHLFREKHRETQKDPMHIFTQTESFPPFFYGEDVSVVEACGWVILVFFRAGLALAVSADFIAEAVAGGGGGAPSTCCSMASPSSSSWS
jgi:hypothetical protein